MTLGTVAKNGTYVGLRVSAASSDLLYETCVDSGVPVKYSMFKERLHTTVIYSRKHCPNILLPKEGTKYMAEPDGYEIFSGMRGENILVLKLNSPEVSELHRQLVIANGATHDYPYFNLHVTLSYNYTDTSVMGILPFKHLVELGEAYSEDLDLNWGR